MINLYVVFGILAIHWVADFLLQTDKMAKGKSSNNGDLSDHVSVYTAVWMIASIIYFGNVEKMFTFMFITFIAHLITDYFTSRLNSKLWKAGKTHWFFVSVGFDQILHYVQLLLTFYYINKGI